MKKIRVLVTGAGSGVGQGIVKSLRLSSLPVSIIAADIAILNTALYRCDEAVLIPKVESEGALEDIIALLIQNEINIVMIGSEFDLEFFSLHKDVIENATGSLVVASPIETVKIANDKWQTSEFLRKLGLPYATSYLPEGIEDLRAKARILKYPVVLKDRYGTASRNVHVILDEAQLEKKYIETPNPVLQQYLNLGNLENEYTCSVFKCSDGTLLGPFTARRSLRGGSSWVIEVGHFEEVYPVLLSIAKHLDVMGSINVQLMRTDKGYVPFEFNARFSGTTAVRAHFGFNEPQMLIENYYFNQNLDAPVIRNGLALRYLEEVFIEGVQIDDLGTSFPKGIIQSWF